MSQVRVLMEPFNRNKKKGTKKNETKTESTKTKYYASVAKWYGNGLLTRIPQVRILSGALGLYITDFIL